MKKPYVSGRDLVLPEGIKELDLAQTLDCGQAFRWQHQEDGSWMGAAMGHTLHIASQGKDLVLYNTTLEEYRLIWRRYFDIGRSYPKLKRCFAKDPVLRQAITYAPGIRVLRQDPWETLCAFIMSANNNISRIKGILDRLCRLFGEPLEDGLYNFPTAQRLASLTEQDLAPLRCGYRTRYLLDAARKVAGGQVSLKKVDRLPTSEAKKLLMTIDGVGPKVADCILLYGFGRVECFPMDTWMKKVMTVLYPDGLPEVALSAAGIAQQYLFHYARHHAELFRSSNPSK